MYKKKNAYYKSIINTNPFITCYCDLIADVAEMKPKIKPKVLL